MTRANAAFLATLEAATARYAGRTDQRDDMRQKLKTEGILAADAPDRVEKRLRRLNADFSVAEAILQAPDVATAGRRLESLSPQLQTADALGLERLLGRNDLIDVGFLERGYHASRSVGRITIRSAGGGLEGYGTGFLISSRLLLTNNHVLGSVDESVNSYVEFDYQAGVDGAPLVPAAFALAPQEFFCTDKELDFTVVAVTARNPHGQELAHYGWLRLMAAEGKAIVGELMNIVQHPNGEPKQLALRENKLVDVLDLFLHYETDTAPGSSGSPVFNDQWEVVALHHSGVPKRDANGDYVADDGSRWTPAMGEGRLQWIANEGVRISRVLAALQRAPLSAQAAQLSSEIGSSTGPLLQKARIEAAETVAEVPTSSAAVDEKLLNEGLASLEANRDRTYYDAPTDNVAAQQYYGTIDDSMSGSELLAALHALLEQTHVRRPRYAPARMVYPWVDLHPDRQLRSIYSGKSFAPEDLIREDARIEAVRTRRLQQLVSAEAAIGPEAFAEELDLLEASLPYNCEHVVPQSSFAKAEPMRGDLHHLFTCESRCNSFRGNTPYFDFTDVDEALMADCGRREDDRFEPRAGKGAVARATMYFLLRYPGLIGDVARELQAERLPILLDWHASEPVGDWERHRNAAIAELQGNRNPLIDHPEWAARIPFASAFGG
ncbi:endonuclease [Mycolicibacterium vaccae]|uniref:endonuclease n=1 Tax=Mycolicibacterium vaccae TaxID=1810 RepID=UPI003CE6EFAE